ncbi:GNAT family N-acetyltransferase, partial [Candidatus Bathyarchaeota archaeon]
ADLIVEIKKIVPEWVRIMRIQRDIPSNLIEAGVKKSNLRQLVEEKLRRLGLKCRCIRGREAGLKYIKEKIKADHRNIEIIKREYRASEGREIFISLEDTFNDVLVGYLRLRFPSESAHRPEIANFESAIIRELHVVGPLTPVGRKPAGEAYQHRGYGSILLREAEEISREEGAEKILVTSALGTKLYYKRFGYDYDGPYMSKFLD